MSFEPISDILPSMGKRPTGDPATLDAPRRALWDAVERSGEDLANLSRRIGRNHAYLRQYLWRKSPAKLDEDDRAKLAVLLGIDAESLKTGMKPQGEQPQHKKPQTLVAVTKNPAVTIEGEIRPGPKTLPILGYVRAGEAGLFIGNGETQGVTVCPDTLIGVTGAYAVRVHDTSMLPVLQPGWLLHVDPHRPCRPGDMVVIQMKDDSAFVKILVRRTEKHVICKQLNPEGEVRYETSKWRSTHRVVGAKFLEE